MQSLLEEVILSQLIAYILVFCRVGTMVMIMPGIGDTFVNVRVRLLFALSFSVVLAPAVSQYLPEITTNTQLIWMVISEMIIGFFIGTIARIYMAALDVAGMLAGMQIGLGNAMVFNPQMAGQGSVIGVFLSIVGVVLLFATNLHHMLIFGMAESYLNFTPGGDLPLMEGMATTVTKAVSHSFAIGFYMSVPFIIVALFLYIAMGVLGRLMPQIQVFVVALPLQILLGLLVLFVILSSLMLFWLNHYDEAIQLFFREIG